MQQTDPKPETQNEVSASPRESPPARAIHPLAACLLLVLVTLAVYWPVTGYRFVDYDDGEYVVSNSHVQAGLTWDGVKWAFRAGRASNWHPLTWISHMADVSVFRQDVGAYHAVNLFFHCANSVLVLLLLRQWTGSEWRSLTVAALFAWHPLHVESVAWISERKDVLCAFFGLLSLWAYSRFAEESKVQSQQAEKRA